MHYHQTITLKDGSACVLRNGTAADGEAGLTIFIRTHEQTDFLLSYPDEITFTAAEEADYLQQKADSDCEIEIFAEVDGAIVGTAGIVRHGKHIKLRHRCDFGVSIDKDYWGRGIGKALLDACIACAKQADYRQMELEVDADNHRAHTMYQKAGFTEYGRNPRAFLSRTAGWQELVYMRLELDE